MVPTRWQVVRRGMYMIYTDAMTRAKIERLSVDLNYPPFDLGDLGVRLGLGSRLRGGVSLQ